MEVAMTNQIEHDRVTQAKEKHWSEILAKPNVVGVGIGMKETRGEQTGKVSMVVMVRQKIPVEGLKSGVAVPATIDGVPTDVIEVGELRALQSRTDRWRPAPGGVSIGHFRITAGTLGCVVRDRQSGDRLILSNNHVLANSNDASPGDLILQPGPTDGGQAEANRIGVLEHFCPIQFSESEPTCGVANSVVEIGNIIARLLGAQHRLLAKRIDPKAVNQVDAALARPDSPADVLDEIYEIGTISGVAPASLGMTVRKSGRTTGLTTGTINVVDATVSVSYGTGRTATFENQLVAGPMSQGGDSGSLVVDGNSLRAVGLLFAGSEQSTIFSPIQLVLDCLRVNL
jgi:hypothetical protein